MIDNLDEVLRRGNQLTLMLKNAFLFHLDSIRRREKARPSQGKTLDLSHVLKQVRAKMINANKERINKKK